MGAGRSVVENLLENRAQGLTHFLASVPPLAPRRHRTKSGDACREDRRNPDHATKAATIDRALRRLGKRVTVTVGEAA